jgi:hypothetical protein
MTEREQALLTANKWLEFDMNALTQMVPGDPDCDACVLARQFIRATDAVLPIPSKVDAVELANAMMAMGMVPAILRGASRWSWAVKRGEELAKRLNEVR